MNKKVKRRRFVRRQIKINRHSKFVERLIVEGRDLLNYVHSKDGACTTSNVGQSRDDLGDYPSASGSSLSTEGESERNTGNISDSATSESSESYSDTAVDDSLYTSSNCEECDFAETDDNFFGEVAEVDSALDVLRKYGHKFNPSREGLKFLLDGLRPYFPELPRDTRTLLGTPRSEDTVKLSEGVTYFYFGVKDGIKRSLDCTDMAVPAKLILNFNVDPVPVCKSTKINIIPILCKINGLPDTPPFLVSAVQGSVKPSLKDFFNDFLREVNELLQDGLVYRFVHYDVCVGHIVCDNPAKNWVKSTVGFNAYSGCNYCTQKGEWAGRVVFPDIGFTSRSDESFRVQEDKSHHINVSPLTNLPIDMIKQFPVDYMHAVLLGVTRKLIAVWMGRKKFRKSVLSFSQWANVSEHIVSFEKYWPSDFNRKPRSLADLDRWKATELRHFLLYYGIIITKLYLPKAEYENFCLLFVGITVLIREDLCSRLVDYAKEVLQIWANSTKQVYGKAIMTSNFHCLTHLADNAKDFGVLDNFSAFPYENYLQTLLRKISKPSLALKQLCLRHLESPIKPSKKWSNTTEVIASSEIDGSGRFKKMMFHGQILFNSWKDGHVLLECDKVLKIQYFTVVDGGTYVHGRVLQNPQSLFTYPTDSKDLNIFVFHSLDNSSSIKNFRVNEIKCKGVFIPCKNKFVFLPMSRHKDH